MEKRMRRWSMACKIFGWIAIVAGLLTFLMTIGVGLACVMTGIGLLFLCAVLEWMDGVLEELQAMRKNQKVIGSMLSELKAHEQSGETDVPAVETEKEPEAKVVYDKAHMSDVYRSTQGE